MAIGTTNVQMTGGGVSEYTRQVVVTQGTRIYAGNPFTYTVGVDKGILYIQIYSGTSGGSIGISINNVYLIGVNGQFPSITTTEAPLRFPIQLFVKKGDVISMTTDDTSTTNKAFKAYIWEYK